MANEKRLIVLDYNAVRKALDEEFKATMELIRTGETHLDNLAEGFTEADRVLRKMPTVDAVEVVRCKDCSWCDDGKCMNPHCGKSWYGCPVPDKHYCSYGERKEKEG